METTATSLKWAILLLANRPDIQDKAYKEIEDVLCSASFSYQDLKKLPYTNAVIHEIQRSKYPFLFGVPRQTAKDVTIRGFLIPKGTICALFFLIQSTGNLLKSSIQNIFWTRMDILLLGKNIWHLVEGLGFVWGSIWPGWSSSSSWSIL
nr:PREDICTED: cytochrome P450 2D20 [Anolis carolinensis]|eukprot:XP_003224372.1 PREDICTED: cytochrome P450 2D20 [Anolis carolinensis]